MLPYVHPFLAALTLALLAYTASLSLRARSDRRNRARWLARHAKIAPWMFAAVAGTWLAGLATTWATRPSDELTASAHYQAAVGLLAVLSASAVSSRWMNVRWVRDVHPWFGVAALLLGAVQVVWGLQLLP